MSQCHKTSKKLVKPPKEIKKFKISFKVTKTQESNLKENLNNSLKFKIFCVHWASFGRKRDFSLTEPRYEK